MKYFECVNTYMATISETTELRLVGSSDSSVDVAVVIEVLLLRHESTERLRCLLVMNLVNVDVDDDDDGRSMQLLF